MCPKRVGNEEANEPAQNSVIENRDQTNIDQTDQDKSVKCKYNAS